MAIIPVTDFVPDAAALGNPGSVSIKNALPGRNSYKPVQSLQTITSALADRPLGAISARDDANNTYNYVGIDDGIYVQNGTGWTDVTRSADPYATAADEVWEFEVWNDGEQVIATNFTDEPQVITMGGANYADLTAALHARHVGVVKDFVVFGNTWDATDGNVPWRVRWSAFNDETDYTVSSATGSDFRDLKSGGWVQKVIGGETGMIISEESIYRQSFVGAPVWFSVDEAIPHIGTYAAGSVESVGSNVYLWSEHGIVQVTGYGTGINFIGAAGRVNEFIEMDLDYANRGRISAVHDPVGTRVYWAYPGSGNTGGRPNKILVYDWTLDKFSLIEEEVELIWRAAAVGYTLDGLDSVSTDLDALPASLDSQQWAGGSANFAAFDDLYAYGFFSGSNMTAEIDTTEVELHPGMRTRLNAFRPLVDGGTVTAQIGSRSRQSDVVTFGSSLTQSASGRFTTRSNDRFHRFRLSVSGDWKDLVGVEVDPKDARAEGSR